VKSPTVEGSFYDAARENGSAAVIEDKQEQYPSDMPSTEMETTPAEQRAGEKGRSRGICVFHNLKWRLLRGSRERVRIESNEIICDGNTFVLDLYSSNIGIRIIHTAISDCYHSLLEENVSDYS
jgi:hypothetical protein